MFKTEFHYIIKIGNVFFIKRKTFCTDWKLDSEQSFTPPRNTQIRAWGVKSGNGKTFSKKRKILIIADAMVGENVCMFESEKPRKRECVWESVW